MKKKKIAVICSSRATYGYKKRIMQLMRQSPKLELQVIVTGMHLLKEYGYSIEEIEKDGFAIAAKVDMELAGCIGISVNSDTKKGGRGKLVFPVSENRERGKAERPPETEGFWRTECTSEAKPSECLCSDSPFHWASSLGIAMQKLAEVFQELEPDFVLVTGDRAEMFIAAAAALYMNIPVGHIQAGDISGHVDGIVRHAITKMSHIHFPACKDSAERVKKMGEEPWRIFQVGAPQLDAIVQEEKFSRPELEKILGIDLKPPFVLAIQHSVLTEIVQAAWQMEETMEALKMLAVKTLLIYPNTDSGGRKMIQVIKRYKNLPFLHIYPNLNRKVFISLLALASALVGNSSTGILEAPSLKLAVVNIGNRQKGRMQASNVLNAAHNRKEIVQALKKALFSKDFKNKLKKCRNPYGDGKSSERIVKILEDIEINEKLLNKIITY